MAMLKQSVYFYWPVVDVNGFLLIADFLACQVLFIDYPKDRELVLVLKKQVL